MRDPLRMPRMLRKIEELWLKNPDLRLCQLLCNLKSGDLFYLEDDELLKMVETQLEAQYEKEEAEECLAEISPGKFVDLNEEREIWKETMEELKASGQEYCGGGLPYDPEIDDPSFDVGM